MIVYFLPITLLLIARYTLFKGSIKPLINYGDFVLVLYFFPLGLGFLYPILTNAEVPLYASLFPMLYLSLCLFIYFFPILAFQQRREVAIDIVNRSLFKCFCVFVLLGGIYSIFIFVPRANFALEYGAADFRQALASGEISIFSGGLQETIAVGFSSFFGLSQLLAFLILSTKVFGRLSAFVAGSLIFSSTSYVFNSLAFAGRDGVVFWAMSLLFCYVFAKRWCRFRVPKFLLIFVIIFIFCGLLVFGIITANRFDSFIRVFSYGAMQMHQFDLLFRLDPPIYCGWLNFKEILLMIGLGPALERQEYWDYYLSNGVKPWTFAFFVGSFLKDFGKIISILLIFVFSFSLSLMLIKKFRKDTSDKIASLDKVFLVYLYSQVGFMGVFYFKHLSLNMYLLVFLILAFALGCLRYAGMKSVINF